MAEAAAGPVPLPWGHQYLVCPPSHFGVLYEINPWMHKEIRVDVDLAQRQWHDMVANLKAAGAEIEEMEPVAGLPDLVFTANAGLVDGSRFVVSRFRSTMRSAGPSPSSSASTSTSEADVASLSAGAARLRRAAWVRATRFSLILAT